MKNPDRYKRSFGPTRREFPKSVGCGARVLAIEGHRSGRTAQREMPDFAAGNSGEWLFHFRYAYNVEKGRTMQETPAGNKLSPKDERERNRQ